MTHKKWVLVTLTSTLLFLMAVTLLNLVIDPLQFFHQAFYPPVYSEEQRYQLPGLAKNYPYDSIIVGSSMTENFRPSYIKEKLGYNTLKLSISGATAKEQFMITDLAIGTGKVKNVIWGIDYFALRGDSTRVRNDFGPFPHYFYQNNSIKYSKYLINIDTTKQSVEIVKALLSGSPMPTQSLDTLYTWDTEYKYSKGLVLKEWDRINTQNVVIEKDYELKNVEQNLQKNVISLVKANPQIQFKIFYPPYSVLQHYYFYKKNKSLFYNELYVKDYIFKEIGGLPNVRLYDFQQEKNITLNLDNYKDLAHHNGKINNFIIDAMAKGDYLVTQKTLVENKNLLLQQVEGFSLEQAKKAK